MIDPDLFARARILVIDDEPANVRLLERMLVTGGFSDISTVTDSREALARTEAFQPDLIMLDLHMPHLDGHAVLQLLRTACGPNEYLPILVLTADTTREAKERALSNGARDFLTKPFDRTEVLLRARNLLETRYLHLALKDENRSLEAKLVHQAFHDPLTGLANRALFRDRAAHAVSRVSRGDRVSLLLLDLDDFKSVNDSLGHSEGDKLLEAVSARLLKATRGCDTVARIGGDEFAVLLEGLQHDDDTMTVVRRITEGLRTPIRLQDREVVVAASIGVAHARAGDRVEELLRNADVAMYRAKDEGKGRHAVFDQTMYTALLERLGLEADLKQAVERGEFRVVYQPIVALDTAAITGVEALVRWEAQDGESGDRQPADFIGVAEQTGLIVPIGRWVLREACRQAREWQLSSSDRITPTMSVNVSGRQLQDPNFVSDVASVLMDTRFPAESLILEITESVLMSNMNSSVDRLHELKGLGVRIAIDDFGTGYCNLSYLQHFPVDMLKIDKSFVTNVARNGGNAVLASSIVGLATNLHLHTVAEGIEDADQRAQLIALGCGFGQGFLFAKPVSADVISGLLRDAPPPRPETSVSDRLPAVAATPER
jgi:diguanylate cyclase (GGDEF)-like protein